jgi:colicin import membrane protein
MPRKLKTFTTSIGFYDLAIAAPSMKAALEAWGSGQNLFQRGFAQETTDPEIVAATLAHPGVVLRRAVGSEGKFTEHAELSEDVVTKALKGGAKPKEKPVVKVRATARENNAYEEDPKAQKAAIIAFGKEKARRDRERAKEEAKRRKAEEAEEREEKRRQMAVQKAQADLERARARHEATIRKLEEKRNTIDEQLDAERQRWKDEEEKLDAKIREARG